MRSMPSSTRTTNGRTIRCRSSELALLAGSLAVLFAKLTQPNHREHNKVHEDRYSSQPRWRANEMVGTHKGASAHGTSENRSVAINETWSLIASDKVEGTAVYDSQGEKLGS